MQKWRYFLLIVLIGLSTIGLLLTIIDDQQDDLLSHDGVSLSKGQIARNKADSLQKTQIRTPSTNERSTPSPSATPSPTKSPTPTPTQAPTPAPTIAPTPTPTIKNVENKALRSDGYVKGRSRKVNPQSYYTPFTGEYWTHRSKAKALLQRYVARASAPPDGVDFEGEKLLPLQGWIVVSPIAQLGNQLFGIMAGFLTALLTGRRFAVKYDGNQMVVFDAFMDTSACGFEWMYTRATAKYGTSPGGNIMFKNKESPRDKSPVSMPMEELTCADLSKVWSQYAHVEFTTNQYFAPLLQRNPHYEKLLLEAFDDDLFGPLGRFLLRSKPDVEKDVDDFVLTKFKERFVVGIHVRTATMLPDKNGHWGDEKDNFDLWYQVADQVAEEYNHWRSPDGQVAARPVTWFVGADAELIRTKALENYPEKVVIKEGAFTSGISLPNRLRAAWVDILILAECHELVTTSWSTYSEVAAGLGTTYHFVVAEKGTKYLKKEEYPEKGSNTEPFWGGQEFWVAMRTAGFEQPTSQPCFQFYFNWRIQDVSCYSPAMVDPEYYNGTRHC